MRRAASRLADSDVLTDYRNFRRDEFAEQHDAEHEENTFNDGIIHNEDLPCGSLFVRWWKSLLIVGTLAADSRRSHFRELL